MTGTSLVRLTLLLSRSKYLSVLKLHVRRVISSGSGKGWEWPRPFDSGINSPPVQARYYYIGAAFNVCLYGGINTLFLDR